MSRALRGAAAVLAASGLTVGTAAAAPVATPVPFHETFPGYTGACDFPITVTFDTSQTMREWPSADGDAVRAHVTGKGSVTITNDVNGKRVTANASGPTLTSKGRSKGTGHWVMIGSADQAEYLPFPPGAWLYSGRISDLDAPSYADVFRGRIVDLCAAVS